MPPLRPAQVVRKLIRLVLARLGTVVCATQSEISRKCHLRIISTGGQLREDVRKSDSARQSYMLRLTRRKIQSRVSRPEFVQQGRAEGVSPRCRELLGVRNAGVPEAGQRRP